MAKDSVSITPKWCLSDYIYILFRCYSHRKYIRHIYGVNINDTRAVLIYYVNIFPLYVFSEHGNTWFYKLCACKS